MLSVILPSRNEMFLAHTVDDIFNKARGEFEVVVILDENDQPLPPRDGLRVIKKEGRPGLRSAINQGVRESKGEFIMKLDAHCMLGESFDTILTESCLEHYVVIPRRYSLEPKDWSIRTHRPIVDYEYYTFPYIKEVRATRTGGKWHSRRDERMDILIDDEMAFQGSCWLTTKTHLSSIDGFEYDATGDEFVLESEELSNKTWLSGGRCIVNKNTWYAHLHKGNEYGRGYFLDKKPMERQRIHHTNFWMHNKWPKQIHTMKWLIDKFSPLPGWPADWENPKYEIAWRKENGLE
jgi:glycosyltransferase involved in cell wall biosynthesis